MKVAVATLGCKVNHYDSAVIEDRLRSEGYAVVPFPAQADAYIVNSCT
jgi:threonylcarbamoyladenosine tRNA methylthiotransferase MtaB